MGMRIAVVTLFPVMIREALAHGVVGRALERGLLEVECFDPREQTTDVHRTVDDRSYGGGPGMVLKAEPLRGAVRAAMAAQPAGSRRVYLGADGRRFEQGMAREACGWPGLVLVAGRYEGVDERFIERETDEQWSIGTMFCRAANCREWLNQYFGESRAILLNDHLRVQVRNIASSRGKGISLPRASRER